MDRNTKELPSILLQKSLLQLQEKKIHLQQPLTIITAGIFPSGEEGKKWRQLQEKLLSKSEKTKHIVAENSDHMINHHQPKIIVDAIYDMIINRQKSTKIIPKSRRTLKSETVS